MEHINLNLEKKVKEELSRTFSSEFNNIDCIEVGPLLAVINTLKFNHEENPEIYNTLLQVLNDFNSYFGSTNMEKTKKYIKTLLDRKFPEMADYIISILPVALNTSGKTTLNIDATGTSHTHSLHQFRRSPRSNASNRLNDGNQDAAFAQKTDKQGAPFYNYIGPAVSAYFASQGIPKKLPSQKRSLVLSQVHLTHDKSNRKVLKVHPQYAQPPVYTGPRVLIRKHADGSHSLQWKHKQDEKSIIHTNESIKSSPCEGVNHKPNIANTNMLPQIKQAKFVSADSSIKPVRINIVKPSDKKNSEGSTSRESDQDNKQEYVKTTINKHEKIMKINKLQIEMLHKQKEILKQKLEILKKEKELNSIRLEQGKLGHYKSFRHSLLGLSSATSSDDDDIYFGHDNDTPMENSCEYDHKMGIYNNTYLKRENNEKKHTSEQITIDIKCDKPHNMEDNTKDKNSKETIASSLCKDISANVFDNESVDMKLSNLNSSSDKSGEKSISSVTANVKNNETMSLPETFIQHTNKGVGKDFYKVSNMKRWESLLKNDFTANKSSNNTGRAPLDYLQEIVAKTGSVDQSHDVVTKDSNNSSILNKDQNKRNILVINPSGEMYIRSNTEQNYISFQQIAQENKLSPISVGGICELQNLTASAAKVIDAEPALLCSTGSSCNSENLIKTATINKVNMKNNVASENLNTANQSAIHENYNDADKTDLKIQGVNLPCIKDENEAKKLCSVVSPTSSKLFLENKIHIIKKFLHDDNVKMKARDSDNVELNIAHNRISEKEFENSSVGARHLRLNSDRILCCVDDEHSLNNKDCINNIEDCLLPETVRTEINLTNNNNKNNELPGRHREESYFDDGTSSAYTDDENPMMECTSDHDLIFNAMESDASAKDDVADTSYSVEKKTSYQTECKAKETVNKLLFMDMYQDHPLEVAKRKPFESCFQIPEYLERLLKHRKPPSCKDPWGLKYLQNATDRVTRRTTKKRKNSHSKE